MSVPHEVSLLLVCKVERVGSSSAMCMDELEAEKNCSLLVTPSWNLSYLEKIRRSVKSVAQTFEFV